MRRPLGLLLVLALLTCGCSSTRSRMPLDGVKMLQLEKLGRDEFVILDTVEGSGTVGRVFCFKTGDDHFAYVTPYGQSAVGIFSGPWAQDAVSAATYKALSKVPDADLILPMTTSASRTGIWCFNSEKATVRGKAIRIKSDRESAADRSPGF